MAVDYDTDDNGLIEIDSAAKLQVVMYDLDGNGTADSAEDQADYEAAFSNLESDHCLNPICIGYELVNDIPLNYDGSDPVIGAYTGDFNGNDYTIHNITVNSVAIDVGGLFENMSGSVYDLNLVDVNVTTDSITNNFYSAGGLVGFLVDTGTIDNVSINSTIYSNTDTAGGLVGYSEGSISNSHAYSNVTADDGYAGGLVGDSDGDAISDSYAYGTVTAGVDFAGGLVGWSSGSISNSHAYSNVTADDRYAGGLVGSSSGSISNSHANGTVTAGVDYAGGLVGWSSGSISNSHAYSNVTAGEDYAGGLVGWSSGSISNSHAYSNVTAGVDYAGGLVGYSDSVIRDSYAHTTVRTGEDYAGGLVGHSKSDIITSYAFGNVTAEGGLAGGLVGRSDSDILASYAVGNVSSVRSTGGLASSCLTGKSIEASYAVVTVNGANETKYGLGSPTCTITNSYWSTDASPDIDVGDYGKTNAELKAPTEYGTGIYADWNVTGTDAPDDTGPWLFGTSEYLPYLYWQPEPNLAPTIGNIEDGVYLFGSKHNIPVAVTDYEDDSLTLTMKPDLSGHRITMDSLNHQILISDNTPAGEYIVTVTVTDPHGATDTSNEFTITINTAPTIDTITTEPVYTPGIPFYIQVTSSDADGGTLFHTMTVIPPTPEIIIDSTSGQITGSDTTPVGTYNATVTVTDTHGAPATSDEFSFIVNTTPTIDTIGDKSALTGKMYSIQVTITGDDGATDPVEYTIDVTPDTDQITIDDGTITVSADTPSNNYTIRVTVTDSFNVDDSDTFTLTVSEQIVNVAPIIRSIGADDMYPPGDTFTISVDAFDSNASDILTYTLDTDLTTDQITIDSDTGIITGSVDVVGAYTITVTVNDGSDESTSDQFILLINTIPVIDAIESNNVYPHGTPFSIQVTSFDADAGDTLRHTMTVTPPTPEITIDSTTGQIIGSDTTPVGTYTATVTVNDTHGATTTSDEFSFIINTAPTIDTIGDRSALTGEMYSIQVTITGDDGSTDHVEYTIDITPDTDQITIDDGTITVSADTPSNNYTITVTVTDSFNVGDSDTFTLIVSDQIVNVAPTIRSIGADDMYQPGDPFAISVDAFDSNAGDILTYTLDTDLTTDQITIDSGTGTITGSVNAVGIYNITVTVTDGSAATASAPFILLINTIPVIDAIESNNVYPHGTQFSIQVTSSDADAGDTLSHTMTVTPSTSEIAIDSTTGQITGSDIIPAGTYTITITVTDSFNAVATTTFSIVVSSSTIQNTPPVISDVNVNDAYPLGDSFTISLDASDADPNDSLTYTIHITPDTDQITIDSATGQITGSDIIPADTYAITVTVTDSFNAVANTTFSIVVSSSTIQNTPPVISDVNVNDAYPLGDSFTISLDASDADPNDSLTYTIHITPDTDQITIDSATGQIIGSDIIPAGTYNIASYSH